MARTYLNGAEEPSFILQKDTKCGTPEIEYTVREWLGHNYCEEANRSGAIYSNTIMRLVGFYQKHSSKLSNKIYSPILDVEFFALYINYNIREPYIPQLETNCKKLLESIDALDKAILEYHM